MRFALKLMLLSAATLAVAALTASPAFATTPITLVKEVQNGTQNCPALGGVYPIVLGGCPIHQVGEARFMTHIFGIEATEAECQLEWRLKLTANGSGYITAQTLTSTNHGTACDSSPTPCTDAQAATATHRFPWQITIETVSGALQGHIRTCIDTIEAGTCEGEAFIGITENGAQGQPETHHVVAQDARIGTTWCEFEMNSETENELGSYDTIHFR